ncbi:MAG: phenylalanine--tRNA ligase subunit alpha, partial [Crocinitomicaceae bacterium]
MKELFTELKNIPVDQRKEVGQLLNSLKLFAEEKYTKNQRLHLGQDEIINELDLTVPPEKNVLGSHHPLSLIRDRIISVFERIGFDTSEGPEIEDDWHNFSALNFAQEHPARDMQDTFFIEKGAR